MKAAITPPRIRRLAVAAVIGVVATIGAPAEARVPPGPVVDIHSAASQGTFKTGTAQGLTFAVVEHEGTSFAGVDDGPIEIVS
jgi:hypothetical protein